MTKQYKLKSIAAMVVVVTFYLVGSTAAQGDKEPPRAPNPPEFVTATQTDSPDLHPSYPEGVSQWTSTTKVNAPVTTYGASAIWTGTEMIVWGGQNPYTGDVNSGGRYSPTTNTWQPTSIINAPSPRENHVAVWTGNEMLIFGGSGLKTGARYNPATDYWTPMAVPSSDFAAQSAIWTGEEMLVMDQGGNGGLYNPRTDQWKSVASYPPPPSVSMYTIAMAWTGQEAIVMYFYWLDNQRGASGGRYDPATDTWHPISSVNAPKVGLNPVTIWTGTDLYVLGGGEDFPGAIPTAGGYYTPDTDTWTQTGAIQEGVNLGVWTGHHLILVEGSGNSVVDGIRATLYDGVHHQLASVLPNYSCFTNLYVPFGTGVWTGDEMLVWGGEVCGLAGTPWGALRINPLFQIAQYSADSDTYIASGRPGESFGTEPLLFSGWDPQYGYLEERVLVHFPFDPQLNLIGAFAYLDMYAYSTGATVMNTTAYRVTAPWNESTTWQSTVNSYDPSALDSAQVGITFGWYGFDVTSAAQQWKQGVANYGLVFNANGSGNRNERAYLAREAGSGAPLLSVVHSPDPFYLADTTPPIAHVRNLPALQSASAPVKVQWRGSDQGRGIQSYDVQVRDEADGNWQDWQTWAIGTQAFFTGPLGHTICFRVRASDFANNLGPWSTDLQCTAFAAGPFNLDVVDIHHRPILSATVQLSPTVIVESSNPWISHYSFYLPQSSTAQVLAAQEGYVAPPEAWVNVTTPITYEVVLQPLDNVIQNPNFEAPLEGSWVISGNLSTALTDTSHSGSFAVGFNSELSDTVGSALLAQSTQISHTTFPTLSFLYTLTSTDTTQNAFKVSVETSATLTDIYTATQPCELWCHVGLDVSSWQGQIVTVTFQLSQNGGQNAQVVLDEVTLGTSPTPLVNQVDPLRVDPGVTTVITVTGESFGAFLPNGPFALSPTVFLDDLPLNTQWVDDQTLTAVVSSTVPFGKYAVVVQNSAGYRGALPHTLLVGRALFLPCIAKDSP